MSLRLSHTLSAATLSVALLAMPSLANALPDGLSAEVYVEGLTFPVKMRPAPDGRILVTEKFGTLRLVSDDRLAEAPIFSVDVKSQNEGGFLDVITTPDFDETGHILVSYTPLDDPDQIYVSRLELAGTSATMVDEGLLRFPSHRQTDRHYAGTMAYAPDGHFFISLGDLRQAALSQDTSNVSGSVLRYRGDFTIPDDNPLGADSPIFAWGLRNPFGLDIGADGEIFSVGNGDNVADELNHIIRGRNYGWPLVEGHCDQIPKYEPCEEDFEEPAHEFRTIVGPTGVLVYSGEMIPAFEGHIFVTGWHSGKVHHLAWNEDRTGLDYLGELFEAPNSDAGLVDIREAADGAILVMESGTNAGTIYRIALREELLDPDQNVESRRDDEGGCATAAPTTPLAGILLMLVMIGFRRRSTTVLPG